MSDQQERAGFQALAQAGADDADAPRALGARLKAHHRDTDMKALAALWVHAAMSAPESLPHVYDAVCEGYLGEPIGVPAIPTDTRLPPEMISVPFWRDLWDLLEQPREGLGALNITTQTAALAGQVSSHMLIRLAKASRAWPGVVSAVGQGYPKPFTLAELAACPPDSLAGIFHALIVENGFDLEVLDRQALGLDKLPAPLDYLNARILQCHDLWHIVGGYQTTSLHEVAISGFQLGQFGHHYSSMFLAMVLTRLAFERPEGGAIILPTILSAYAHGRRTPPMLPVRWPSVWALPLDEVRARLGVTAYVSPFPADLFEQLSAAA